MKLYFTFKTFVFFPFKWNENWWRIVFISWEQGTMNPQINFVQFSYFGGARKAISREISFCFELLHSSIANYRRWCFIFEYETFFCWFNFLLLRSWVQPFYIYYTLCHVLQRQLKPSGNWSISLSFSIWQGMIKVALSI